MENCILFFTATILDWKHLLKPDSNKQIIIDSLGYLSKDGRIWVYGFVIMPNHIHILWSMQEGYELKNVQRDFLKYTAQQLKFRLIDSNSPYLESFRRNKSDREFQFWQRNSYNIRVVNREICEQKLDYIHNNPLQQKWQLVKNPVDYKYSTAKYYELNQDDWGFITHYYEHIF
jgi:REP element-mobilizing transposase RayT